jgi:hypothetical protein
VAETPSILTRAVPGTITSTVHCPASIVVSEVNVAVSGKSLAPAAPADIANAAMIGNRSFFRGDLRNDIICPDPRADYAKTYEGVVTTREETQI